MSEKEVESKKLFELFEPSPNPRIAVPEDFDGMANSLKLGKWFEPQPNPNVPVPEDFEA
ncbi:MAG: hypothetical protein SXQ77_07060 [Halobacteria archaeon]|nr:hypothetical protein [Halobacteria archaeon]